MTNVQEQDKRKGGRPPTGRIHKLSKSVTVKFSKPSYEALRLRARKANRKLAEYIRESALNGEVVSGHNTETVAIAKNRRRLSQYYMDRSLALVRGEVASESASSEQIVGSDSSYELLEPTGASEEKKDDTVLNKQGQTFDNVAEAVLNPQDQAFVDRATSLVLAHLSDTNFNIDRLCREMAMSRTLFYGRLKTLTGQSPQDFMRLIRLEQAAIFLKQGDSVLEVSVKAGFVNVKYFSTVFKKHFGVSPSKYL